MTQVTNRDLADALGCFWNAAIGEAHNRQSPTAMDVASVMAIGLAAVAARLDEVSANPPTPDVFAEVARSISIRQSATETAEQFVRRIWSAVERERGAVA